MQSPYRIACFVPQFWEKRMLAPTTQEVPWFTKNKSAALCPLGSDVRAGVIPVSIRMFIT